MLSWRRVIKQHQNGHHWPCGAREATRGVFGVRKQWFPSPHVAPLQTQWAYSNPHPQFRRHRTEEQPQREHRIQREHLPGTLPLSGPILPSFCPPPPSSAPSCLSLALKSLPIIQWVYLLSGIPVLHLASTEVQHQLVLASLLALGVSHQHHSALRHFCNTQTPLSGVPALPPVRLCLDFLLLRALLKWTWFWGNFKLDLNEYYFHPYCDFMHCINVTVVYCVCHFGRTWSECKCCQSINGTKKRGLWWNMEEKEISYDTLSTTANICQKRLRPLLRPTE